MGRSERSGLHREKKNGGEGFRGAFTADEGEKREGDQMGAWQGHAEG
jgi:hypothetical protein